MADSAVAKRAFETMKKNERSGGQSLGGRSIYLKCRGTQPVKNARLAVQVPTEVAAGPNLRR